MLPKTKKRSPAPNFARVSLFDVQRWAWVESEQSLSGSLVSLTD